MTIFEIDSVLVEEFSTLLLVVRAVVSLDSSHSVHGIYWSEGIELTQWKSVASPKSEIAM